MRIIPEIGLANLHNVTVTVHFTLFNVTQFLWALTYIVQCNIFFILIVVSVSSVIGGVIVSAFTLIRTSTLHIHSYL